MNLPIPQLLQRVIIQEMEFSLKLREVKKSDVKSNHGEKFEQMDEQNAPAYPRGIWHCFRS